MVQVLIADDSPSVRRLLEHYLKQEGGFRVVASVTDGQSAMEAVEHLRPDVVLLDMDMPGVDGLTALRWIMSHRPTPTVMISGAGVQAAKRTVQALEEGAVDFIPKHHPEHPTAPGELRRQILAKVRIASRIRPIRSLAVGASHTKGPHPALPLAPAMPPAETLPLGVVVIGASTGGPVALRHLLSQLPEDFPLPVVIVQHIPDSFIHALAGQLDRHTALSVQPASDGARLVPGTVLVAPGDTHLLVASDGRVHLQDGPPIHGHRPAIDITMQSAARTFGARTCGVLLTGMGVDGADGLCAIRVVGGRTFAQDEASSVVWGMPRHAAERGMVDQLAPPTEIAHQLLRPPVSAGLGQGVLQ